ncbi:MAG: hypothetical protein HN922_05670 [Anaerolineae bacterium]|jgi:hypothetical protein|nr:hypothetical protein [Anaerolineae bacterium]MBT7783503.1 hypothetical protein [Anaerolineae bacterium]
MPRITETHINRLIEFEASVQYDKSPPIGEKPFIVIDGKFPILISAPHGARTFRDNDKEVWHEEDEYTAGMAMLLKETCNTSAIATIFKNEDYDPNYVSDNDVPYKQELRETIKTNKIKYVIDLHGAGKYSKSLANTQLVDLGLGSDNDYLPKTHMDKLVDLIEFQLGDGATSRNGKRGFPAAKSGTVAYFCNKLGVEVVQIEMRPQLRVAHRFQTASLYKNDGKYDADPNCITHMLQALVDFIEYLKEEAK